MIIILALAHPHEKGHDLSDIYLQYQKESQYTEFESRPATFANPNNFQDYKGKFFPPLPGQTHVDFHPQLRVPPGPKDPLIYYSWHIHTYFYQDDKNVTDRCLAFRTQFMETFNVPVCTGNCFMGGIFDNCTQGMCVWDPNMDVDGPHPYAQWGVFLPNEDVLKTLVWFTANHGEFVVLFHPNTGLMVGDHDENRRAVWIGSHPVHLDINFLIWLQCKWFGCNNGFRSPLNL